MMQDRHAVTFEEAELNRKVLTVINSMTDVQSVGEFKAAVWGIFKSCYADEIEKHGGGRDAEFDVWMLYSR